MAVVEISRIMFGLVTVIGLIAGFAFIAHKIGFAKLAGAARSKRRLSVVESLALDARRKLLIIRCDDTEHVIVSGPNGDTLIKSAPMLSATTAEEPAAPSIHRFIDVVKSAA